MPLQMKNWALLLTALLLATGLFCQATADSLQTPPAIRFFIEGLSNHSYGTAANYISPDFSIEGVPSEYMKRALTQIFSTFPHKITRYSVKSIQQEKTGTVYTMSLLVNSQMSSVTVELDKDNKVVSFSMFKVQAPDSSSRKQSLKPYAELDFTLKNGIILIPVEVNGEQKNFILDSGAPILVLNSHPDSTKSVIALAAGVGGDINGMGMQHVDKLTWGGGTFLDFDAVTMDLSHLETEVGGSFAGLISKAELEPFEVFFDYQKHQICLYLLQTDGKLCEPERLTLIPKQVIPFELQGHIATFKAKVGKKTLPLGLDTGAQTNLLTAELYPKYEKDLKEVETDTLRGADVKMTTVTTGVIAQTKVGKLDFPDMRYVFSDISQIRDAYGVKIEGLLGYPALSKYPVSINYRKKTLSFY